MSLPPNVANKLLLLSNNVAKLQLANHIFLVWLCYRKENHAGLEMLDDYCSLPSFSSPAV